MHLARLFERWGIAQDIKQRIVQRRLACRWAPVARGDVELGFQQLSELLHLQGIDVLGMLPDEIQYITLFSAGVCASSRQIANVRAMLEFMTSREADEVKRRHGMEPALSRDY